MTNTLDFQAVVSHTPGLFVFTSGFFFFSFR